MLVVAISSFLITNGKFRTCPHLKQKSLHLGWRCKEIWLGTGAYYGLFDDCIAITIQKHSFLFAVAKLLYKIY